MNTKNVKTAMMLTVALAMTASALFTACKNNEPSGGGTGSNGKIGSNVYVAGVISEFGNNNDIATLWNGGNEKKLFEVTRDYTSGGVFINSAFVTESDTYFVGTERTDNIIFGGIAKVWKNGTGQNLTDGTNSAEALSVFASGSDVYVAGYESVPDGIFYYKIAKIWKNGVAQVLTDSTHDAEAYFVYVTGGDVYAVGYRSNDQYNDVATLWKNGVAQNLSDGTLDAYANAVCVTGSDVYAAGYQTNANGKKVAMLWKNGAEQVLSDGIFDAYANAVCVSGSDVYVAVNNQGGDAQLWKNGAVQNTFDISTIYSLYASGSDIYAVGSEGGEAVLWKNGKVQYLTKQTSNSNSTAFAIYVK